MAFYAYKAFLAEVSPDDQARLVAQFCKEADRDFDDDADQDGDYWVIAAMYVRELKDKLSETAADRDLLSTTLDDINQLCLENEKLVRLAVGRLEDRSLDDFQARQDALDLLKDDV
jgi:hypothetical protein